jgi:putative GTP pyrophosphokinase
MSIYGEYEEVLEKIKDDLLSRLKRLNEEEKEREERKLYEYIIARIKTDESVREKCKRRGFPVTSESALLKLTDSIGIRVICGFLDDVYRVVDRIKAFDDCELVEEKDYILNAKPNGYRSYHMIMEVEVPYRDIRGNLPGRYFVEFQVRTIAMDTWASLEHEIKYKRRVENQAMITSELKKCADELAACDLSLRTIRNLINQKEGE